MKYIPKIKIKQGTIKLNKDLNIFSSEFPNIIEKIKEKLIYKLIKNKIDVISIRSTKDVIQGFITKDHAIIVESNEHPKIQINLVKYFQDKYPDNQLFIFSNSPFVLNSVKEKYIFFVDKNKFWNPIQSYGMSIERISEDLLKVDTRPISIKEAIHRLYMHISNNEIEIAKTLLRNLQKEIGSDTELTKAEVLIKRKEIIGK